MRCAGPAGCAENRAVKVLLLNPAPAAMFLGSTATVLRLRGGLQRQGHLCEVFGDTNEGGLKQSLEGTIGRFRPDIVHAHDAFRTGISLLGLRVPWVVSLTGEDFHRDMLDEQYGMLVCEVFRQAHRVLVPGETAVKLLEERVPETVGKIDVVPRGCVRPSTDGTDLRRSLGIPRGRFLVLLAGGIRAMKGQLRAVGLVRTLREQGVDAEMIIAGPCQESEYARELKATAAGEPGVRVLPPLSRERMGAAYMDADVILNTSWDEGMSPVILEAGMLARPVVASDVPGNRELVRHRETGLLFATEAELASCVLAVARNRSAAGAMGLRMREDFERRFVPAIELDRLLSAYAAA
jgi:glycosyltransferase involved in cell wall biosynthesis